MCCSDFFVVKDNSPSDRETLEVIKKWNPDWCPDSFMIDGSEMERWAVKQLFPGSYFLNYIMLDGLILVDNH